MTRLSRQIKNLHAKYGKDMSLKAFARSALSKETKLSDDHLLIVSRWLDNKAMPPRPAIANKNRLGGRR